MIAETNHTALLWGNSSCEDASFPLEIQGETMANNIIKLDVHIIFHIKSTSVIMKREDLPRIFTYIGGVLRRLGSIPMIVGGVSDYIHLLTSLPSTMTLADLVRTVKANSSRWVKSLAPDYAAFAWQDGYGAFSVSPSILNRTIQYIANQEQHHQGQSFQDEFKAFLNAYKIPYDERYLFID